MPVKLHNAPVTIAIRTGLRLSARTGAVTMAASPRLLARPREISMIRIVTGNSSSVLKAMIAVIGPTAASPKVSTISGRPSRTVLEKPAPMPSRASSSPGRRNNVREKTMISAIAIRLPPK